MTSHRGAVSLEIVAATRSAEAEFATMPLGRSLHRLRFDERVTGRISLRNTQGLPEVYNSAIRQSTADILIFVHDDVWIETLFLADTVASGLAEFDVIGIAGNRRRRPDQWAWGGPEPRDRSGAIGHGDGPLGSVTWFGSTPAECELLDGVLLAASPALLRRHDVVFDPRFRFHFYDLDFCRTARQRGLRLGTWPLSITHASVGAFTSPEWGAAREEYRAKWGG
jgi:GT2 family glycosyltransferase